VLLACLSAQAGGVGDLVGFLSNDRTQEEAFDIDRPSDVARLR
jgi:hypothetical protein